MAKRKTKRKPSRRRAAPKQADLPVRALPWTSQESAKLGQLHFKGRDQPPRRIPLGWDSPAQARKAFLYYTTGDPNFITFFASGTNSVGDIRGFLEAGSDIGTVVQACNEWCMREYLRASGKGNRVFVDSGAYSEIDKSGKVVKPMSAHDWKKVFQTYFVLADPHTFGYPGKGLASTGQLYVVAPDRIGDSKKTYERLNQYMMEMALLYRLGAHIIVPIQWGKQSMVQFDREAMKLFNADPAFRGKTQDLIRGIPMPKNPPTMAQLETYLKTIKPKRIHFLGMSPTGKKWPAIKKLLQKWTPNAEVYMDAGRRRQLVGRASGMKPLTAAEDRAMKKLLREAKELVHGRDLDTEVTFLDRETGKQLVMSMRMVMGYPESWITRPMRKYIVEYLELERKVSPRERKAIMGSAASFGEWYRNIFEPPEKRIMYWAHTGNAVERSTAVHLIRSVWPAFIDEMSSETVHPFAHEKKRQALRSLGTDMLLSTPEYLTPPAVRLSFPEAMFGKKGWKEIQQQMDQFSTAQEWREKK